METRPTSPTGFNVFLAGTSVALAPLVGVLAFENLARRRALAQESDAPPRDSGARFTAGERLPPLALLAHDGSVERLAFDGTGHGTLLLFYAEACNVCPQAFV